MGLTFLWPIFLAGLLLIPLLVAVYARLLRRAHPQALPYSTTPVAVAATQRGRRWYRYLPPALLLLAVAVATLALARPVAVIPLPADRSAIMLALDSSGSMRSQDILPTRLDAAKAAAKDFIAALPPRVRVGLVMFGGYAQVLVPPGTDREGLREAIDGLGFIRRTAIGEGLLEAVAVLPGRTRASFDGTLPPPPPGGWPPAVVVLLSDGRSNTGIDPLEAAQIARRQEVTVHTVGIGQLYTPDNSWTIGGPLDEETLKEMARLAGGRYHHASSAEGLRDVYRQLARSVGWERKPVEAGGVAAVFSAAALVAALLLSRLYTQPLGI